MCQWNAEYKHQRLVELNGRWESIDACFVDLLRVLNAAGFHTIASCCGHGHRPGSIAFKDGTEFVLLPDYETARRVSRLFPEDIHGGWWMREPVAEKTRQQKWRGHAIEQTPAGNWIYSDTKQPVKDNIDISCGHCGRPKTKEGHDGCLGTIPGAMNACCGHGNEAEAYVQFPTEPVGEKEPSCDT